MPNPENTTEGPSSAGECAFCGRYVEKRYGGMGRCLAMCWDCWQADEDYEAFVRRVAPEHAELILHQNARLRALLHRWLLAASAMGDGPRAVLTQDTLDAVGMPDV